MRGFGFAPTPLGLKGALLLIVFELAYLATPYSNLFFALIAYCSVLGAFGVWWTARNVAGVEVTRCAAKPGVADAPRTIELTVAGGRRRRFDLAVAVQLDGRWIEVGHLPTLTGETVVEALLPGMPRGIHMLRRCRLESRWPLGLFRVRRLVTVAAEVVVWPAPRRSRRRRTLAANAAASRHDAVGLRPFRSGDSVSDVHWKATARRAAPVVRDRPAIEVVDVVLDRRCAAPELELRLADAAAGILDAAAADQPVRLRSHDYTADSRSRATTEGMLRWLAGATTLEAAEAGGPR